MNHSSDSTARTREKQQLCESLTIRLSVQDQSCGRQAAENPEHSVGYRGLRQEDSSASKLECQLRALFSGQAIDVLKLAVNESTFEAVIDKGTMDSILVRLHSAAALCMHLLCTVAMAGSTDWCLQHCLIDLTMGRALTRQSHRASFICPVECTCSATLFSLRLQQLTQDVFTASSTHRMFAALTGTCCAQCGAASARRVAQMCKNISRYKQSRTQTERSSRACADWL